MSFDMTHTSTIAKVVKQCTDGQTVLVLGHGLLSDRHDLVADRPRGLLPDQGSVLIVHLTAARAGQQDRIRRRIVNPADAGGLVDIVSRRRLLREALRG